ncbi:MAG: 50S ribosomal protein L29 [Candidatus Nanosyncoccaceae bacterium]|jgi:ribosomal protein L29
MAKENKINLAKLSLEDLNQLLVDKKSDLFHAKQSLVNNNLANFKKISNLKKQIAQIHTRINLLINKEGEK